MFRLVLTGGPCSGKSSSLKTIREFLEGYEHMYYKQSRSDSNSSSNSNIIAQCESTEAAESDL